MFKVKRKKSEKADFYQNFWRRLFELSEKMVFSLSKKFVFATKDFFIKKQIPVFPLSLSLSSNFLNFLLNFWFTFQNYVEFCIFTADEVDHFIVTVIFDGKQLLLGYTKQKEIFLCQDLDIQG